jgi:hypothetical protein
MVQFNGVQIFSASKFEERRRMGDEITAWLRANPERKVVDREVRQSSDSEYHCVTIILFYQEVNLR